MQGPDIYFKRDGLSKPNSITTVLMRIDKTRIPWHIVTLYHSPVRVVMSKYRHNQFSCVEIMHAS